MSDELEVHGLPAFPGSSGLIRTFFVFLELQAHVEYRVSDLPLMPEGVLIDLSMSLRHPTNPKRARTVDGTYLIRRRKLVYTTQSPKKMGLTQYLEIEPTK